MTDASPLVGFGCVALAGAMAVLVVLVIAFVSTPMVHAFGDDPRNLNTFVAYFPFPFVWLPSVLVVAALVGHIALTKKLILG